jgi:signal transduction histidine kinase
VDDDSDLKTIYAAAVDAVTMTKPKVTTALLIAIATMAIGPLAAALYFVDDALTKSLNLGFNRQIVTALEHGAADLKLLARLDPDHREGYRVEFERLQELEGIYGSSGMIKDSLRHSLVIYFSIGTLIALSLSVAVAALLSRRISRSFRFTFDDLTRHRERVRYLEEMSSWQELAKMLAHEIKNPLTPIEVLATSLSRAYLAKPQEEFREQLDRTVTMINEELSHLKSTVNKFSEFARLPVVRLQRENLREILVQHINAISAIFDGVPIELHGDAASTSSVAQLDATLFRRVLMNIVRNGIEANPGRIVRFKIELITDADAFKVVIANDGDPVATEIAERIFDPYVSSKSEKDNMGLGLAIVRKIVIEHGGDIVYAEVDRHPSFMISLPKFAS